MAIPKTLSHVAEMLVGLVLLMLGLVVIINLVRHKIHLHFHSHDNLPRHAHWHSHHNFREHSKNPHHHRHQATLVGVLHGMAGSAPLLALLPLSQWHSPWWGMAYLFLFCLGVLSSMLLFGGILNGLFVKLENNSQKALTFIRGMTGLFACGMGIYWLQGSF
jgi:sulfite exporter TauE/SafE